MKLLLLGAGHIGQTIAALLNRAPEYQLTVSDRDVGRLTRFKERDPSATLVIDVDDAAALSAALRRHDAVINALPFHAAQKVAAAACATGAHYFDLTEDVAATRAIAALAQNAGSVLAPQCGLAPGFVGIVAHDLAQRFHQLDTLHMRVGALPRYPTNALKYNLTWSTEGLINEYCNPCDSIVHGRRSQVAALDGLETFALDGVEYEAFNTSGGLGTLCETLEGKVRSLDYKSVRYPGHCSLMRLLLNDLRLRDRRDILREVFEAAIPTTLQDVVLVFVTAAGWRADEFVQESFTAHIHGRIIDGVRHSAIQLTTAAGVLTVLDLVRTGQVPTRGFLRQEAIPFEAFRANRFADAYFASRPEVALG